MVVPSAGRPCVDSSRRSLPPVVVTAALALFVDTAPGQYLVAAASSSTMEESSVSDADAADDDTGDGDGDDDTDDSGDNEEDSSSSRSNSSPSPSTGFPATNSPTSTPELMTSTDAPTDAPTMAPTAAVTAALQGSLGAGMVRGTLSATGVSILLIDTVGEEGIIQAAVCALTPCPGGTTSVVVGEPDLETRRLLEAKGAAESQRSLPRRLFEFEAVAFAVPTEDSGDENGEGGLTGIQYAATMINQMADLEGLSRAASVLGVDTEEMSFEDVRYFQGAEVPIAADFEFVLQQDVDDADEAGGGGALAALVIGPLILLVGCLMLVFVRQRRVNSNKKRSNVQDQERRRMASFAVESPGDVGNEDHAAREQVWMPNATPSRHTPTTSKALALVPPQAAEVAKTSVDTALDEMEKPSSPHAGDNRIPSFQALSSFQASRENLYEYYGLEYEDSEACSDLAGLALVPGATWDDNYNPLFAKEPPRSPISAMTTHPEPQRTLQSVSKPPGPSRASWPRVQGREATVAAAAVAVKASIAAARSPVSTVTTPKPRWRSSSPGNSPWGKAPTALKCLTGDDETETSSNALNSAATSTATEQSFAPCPSSVTRKPGAAPSRSSSLGLWDVEEVPGGRHRPNRVSHDGTIQTTESVSAHPATESRPEGAATATERLEDPPLSPPVGGDGAGVEDSKPLSYIYPDGEADSGEALTGGVETTDIEIGAASTETTTSPRAAEVNSKGNGSSSREAAHKPTDQQTSERLEGTTSACTGCLPDTTPQNELSTIPGGRDETVTSAAAADSNSTNEPREGDDVDGGKGDEKVDGLPVSSLVHKSLAYLSDRTSSLMDELISAVADKGSRSTPTGRSPGISIGSAGENDSSIPSSSIERTAPVTKAPVPKQVHFQPVPSLQMPERDAGGLSQSWSASGTDEQDGCHLSRGSRPTHEQQEKSWAKTTRGRQPHRRVSSGSTDSSLASLPNSPAFKKRFPNLTAQEEEETDSWFSSTLSFHRREIDALPRQEPESFPRPEPGSIPRQQFEEAESAPSSAPVSPNLVKGRNFSFVVTPRTQTEAAAGAQGRACSAAAARPSAPHGDEHRTLPDTWQGVVETTEETRERSYSATASGSPRSLPYVGKHGALPATWQGVVEAAAREAASEQVRMTRSSSMPDSAAYSRGGRKQGPATGYSRNGKKLQRSHRTVRFLSVDGGNAAAGTWDGVTMSAADPRIGAAYYQLLSNRAGSPIAVRPTQVKARPTRAKVRFSH